MSQEKPGYKDTIYLPVTSFPMKADLPVREPQFITNWLKNKTYEKMLEGKTETFAMPDGPPYANGNIHVGHALNKTLKDIVIKYKNMSGKSAVFIPGWDCHGLPIELGVSKDLGAKRKDISDKEFRQLCREYALKWVNTQREQFKRLGILADWENPYMTLQAPFEAEEVRQLAHMVDTGSFYRGEKPVFWCWPLQTALADTEVEYHEHTSPSIYVKFEVKKGLEKLGNPKGKTFVVIWTTTPWTLPANLAISLNPELDYALFTRGDGENYLFAAGLVESVAKHVEMNFTQVGTRTWKGSDLEGMITSHPWLDRESPILLGEHVSLDAGTGCVHTAPGHGVDDFNIGKKYGLPAYCPVDVSGKYTVDVPEWQGIQVFEANPLVIQKLKDGAKLLFETKLTHSYPHCWRTKKPLIYRATSQWFLAMDHAEDPIRKKAMAAIHDVRWVPTWGQNRITAMVENRPDWCLSRQRLWGVPIPVFACKNCGENLVSSKIMRVVADCMEKGDGIQEYFESSASRFTEGEKCAKCGKADFDKGKDILDVWFDSGIVHSAVQRKRKGLKPTADLYLEGSDQHRGWFQTSLLTSIAAHGIAPFKTVLTHGFVNDLKGRKMSKSVGNIVEPADVIKKYGAEILRLWVSHEDYSDDLTCGDESFVRMSETYRRIRNTMRFLLGNIHDFDFKTQAVAFEKMPELDQWALIELNDLIATTTNAYENYEFHKIYHAVNNFITVDLSATYLDVLKDRLYVDRKDGLSRRSAQTVLHHLTHALIGILAPILSFLSEEVYTYLPEHKESIFLTKYPVTNPAWKNAGVVDKFAVLLKIRAQVSKVLEELRQSKVIGASLEAQVKLTAAKDEYKHLKAYEKDLRTFFIVSHVELKEGEFKIEALKANGDKCVRCWRYDKLGTHKDHPELCPRCTEALT